LRFWVKLFLLGLLVALGVCLIHDAFAVTYQDASGQVADADQALRTAFNSVVDAEQHGANVSVLLFRLDGAGGNLTLAEMALAAGNFSDAVSLAGVCRSEAVSVDADAVALGNDAVVAAGYWWMMVVFSVVGSVVFVVVLVFVWRRLKAGYLKRVMGSRPEVKG
jgi:hypothetical protein